MYASCTQDAVCGNQQNRGSGDCADRDGNVAEEPPCKDGGQEVGSDDAALQEQAFFELEFFPAGLRFSSVARRTMPVNRVVHVPEMYVVTMPGTLRRNMAPL